ncbi:MAG: Nramp family divalent metal transporter [Planctomycetota bacterium]|nr:Nramp family divalent metal transporter [Planctomycetota bacterium]MDA1178343.1 Nramp family divalent metal transporter [Planctomycetota bacterium]
MANLPAWGHDELPEPLPFSFGNALRTIGPGAILLATAIGGGEWLAGPMASVNNGLTIMWVATVGIVLQVLFNLEAIRYTLYTGEPILSGIMRLRPGANFWGSIYVLLTALQLGVPALATACASVAFAATFNRPPVATDQQTIVYITYGIFGLTIAILSLGGTVERMLERVSWAMIAYVFVFLTTVNLLFVPFTHWYETLLGFFSFGSLPHVKNWSLQELQHVDWAILATLAITAGSGGIGNLTITNWVRDKGMGMGACVGAIPSVVGGRSIELSHTGKIFTINPVNLQRWKTWWRYIVLDQVWLWALGCFVGMYLNVNLATSIAASGDVMSEHAAGTFQADYMGKNLWRGLWYLGLLNGFWILFSTQLGNTDILVRTITDVVWVASTRLRNTKKLSVGRVYFLLLALFTVTGCILANFGSAMKQFQFLALIAAIIMVPASLQILRVNTTLLPPELRPSWWRQLALILCALFYATVIGLVVFGRLMPPKV